VFPVVIDPTIEIAPTPIDTWGRARPPGWPRRLGSCPILSQI